jgi:hypothetical protein
MFFKNTYATESRNQCAYEVPGAGRWRESTPALRDLTLVEFCAYRDAAGGVTRSLAFDAHGKH